MKKNKSKSLFNIVDVLLLIVIILCAVLVFKYSHRFTGSPENNTARYENIELIFESESISNKNFGNITIGDAVVDVENGYILGQITDYSRIKELSQIEKLNGENEGRVSITVSCYVNFSGDYYTYNDKKVIIGENYKLSTPMVFIDAECVLIRRINDSNKTPVVY